MTIHLYAEHLINIRALSIQAALSTVSNKRTRATLSADGDSFSLEHEGETATISLPITVPGDQSEATLTIPAAPSRHLSFRVSLQEKPASATLLANGTTLDSDNIVPWTADVSTAATEIRCMHCHSVFLQRQTVKVWKNLPSENWAEMMDFWHCHRPHVPHNPDHKAPVKGYGAYSTLTIQSGVGLVDPVDFVLAPEDCVSLKILPTSSANHDDMLLCAYCDTIIGHVHTSEGYKLRKQHLSLSPSPGHQPATYPPEKWFACLLLASIDTQGVRKFIVQSTTSDQSALKLWIFTPEIDVSSSAVSTKHAMRAVKVFWQDFTLSSQDVGALNRQAFMEGELELPPQELHHLREILVESKKILPEPARKFQEWHVALLPRFTKDDVEHTN